MTVRHGIVRPPAVAGAFYPATAKELGEALDACFTEAVNHPSAAPIPRALVVPHAGYVYSGAVAAGAYGRLANGVATTRCVVLLGPCHRVPIRGLAVSTADAWRTPLGDVPVDTERVAALLSLPGVTADDAAHAAEHSLEVQVPFLQTVLDDITLVPIVVGDAMPGDVAAAIDLMWEGPSTIVVVSTDLSHHHPYREAVLRDRRTADAIVGLRGEAIGDRDACGARPLRGLLSFAADRRLDVELIDLRNSGDTAGGTDSVVGYGAFALW